jgi:predicted Zn-dependent protease
LGLTAKDLYFPLLTFVFGEAQLNGKAAIISLFRLRAMPMEPYRPGLFSWDAS